MTIHPAPTLIDRLAGAAGLYLMLVIARLASAVLDEQGEPRRGVRARLGHAALEAIERTGALLDRFTLRRPPYAGAAPARGCGAS